MGILSVCLSRPGVEIPGLHHMPIVSSFLCGNLVPLGEKIPLEPGHQRRVPPLEIVILPLLARLA